MFTSFLLAQLALPSFPAPQDSQDVALTLSQESQEAILFGCFHSDWVFVVPGNKTEASWLGADPANEPFADGTEVRRAEIGVEGKLNESIFYQLEIDLAAYSPEITDSYMGVSWGDGDSLKIGHMRQAVGLGKRQSSKHMTFMDYPLTTSILPDRDSGIVWERSRDRYFLSAGAARETDEGGNSAGNEGWAISGRAVYRPLYSTQQNQLLHLGLTASHRVPDEDVSFGARLASHMLPEVVDTGAIATSSVELLGAEMIWVSGSFYALADYLQAGLDMQDFSATTLEAGWFLTGEPATYSLSKAAMGGPSPTAPAFQGKNGKGAWQLLFRRSTLDLTDAAAVADELIIDTFGVNVLLTKTSKVVLNVSRADVQDSTWVGSMRFSYAF